MKKIIRAFKGQNMIFTFVNKLTKVDYMLHFNFYNSQNTKICPEKVITHTIPTNIKEIGL